MCGGVWKGGYKLLVKWWEFNKSVSAKWFEWRQEAHRSSVLNVYIEKEGAKHDTLLAELMRILHCKRLQVWENEPPVWGELEWSHNHPLVAEVYCYIKCSTVPLPGDMQTRQVFIRRHVPSSMWGISCIGKAGTVGINGAFLGPAGFVHCFFFTFIRAGLRYLLQVSLGFQLDHSKFPPQTFATSFTKKVPHDRYVWVRLTWTFLSILESGIG